jgi:phosphocarrier protein
MPEREVKIVNKLGIHARPAAEIVKVAGKFRSSITIVRTTRVTAKRALWAS